MMENENVREAFNEMMREKNTLKQRTKGMAKSGNLSDSDMSDDDDDDEEAMSEEELRKRAIGDIEDEVNDSEDDEEGEESDSEADFQVNFGDNSKSKQKASSAKDKGIMGLKFMKRGEEKMKEQRKEQAKMLV